MVSSLFLLMLVVCGLVGARPGPEHDEPQVKVAFSATLLNNQNWTSLGPYEKDETLKFERVVTNIGNGYDPATGVFTAPAKGLYYVQITGMVGSSGTLNAGLKKNGENMFAIHQKAGTQASASNGMTLALEQGDRLFVQLWAGQTIADQSRLSTFTGFLVFPM
ncbi:complement C1q-like protein 2 [Kryptolebias marmoratus]|uniref:Complement C1q-like protein 2 n=1 Tax=Kryptolebias marmoratus TaxID=37003 RepID=A0A3Q3AUF7_KRYMA|nr:complement C1q-like protein 2 [Kryptolebias marmoratus]